MCAACWSAQSAHTGPWLQVGEFVEVSNNSDTDPCAWVGVVDKIPPAGKTIKVGSLISVGSD